MCLSQLDIQYADGDDNVVGGDDGSDVVVVVAFAATSIDGVGGIVNDDDDDDDLSTAAKESLSYLSLFKCQRLWTYTMFGAYLKCSVKQ